MSPSDPLSPAVSVPHERSAAPLVLLPAVLGLFGLGLAWRRAAPLLAIDDTLSWGVLLVAGLILAAVASHYARAIRHRPALLGHHMRDLPGMSALPAANLSLMLLAAALVRDHPGPALGVLALAMASHLALGLRLLIEPTLRPAARPGVTPVWHMVLVGWIITTQTLTPLGLPGLSQAILSVTAPVAVAIWGHSLGHLAKGQVPAALRPLLAIHLAPASLMAVAAGMLDLPGLSLAFLALASLILALLLAAAGWIVRTGFSPGWGAFTFPLAAYANALFVTGFAWPGLVVTLGASALTLIVAARLAHGLFQSRPATAGPAHPS